MLFFEKAILIFYFFESKTSFLLSFVKKVNKIAILYSGYTLYICEHDKINNKPIGEKRWQES